MKPSCVKLSMALVSRPWKKRLNEIGDQLVKVLCGVPSLSGTPIFLCFVVSVRRIMLEPPWHVDPHESTALPQKSDSHLDTVSTTSR